MVVVQDQRPRDWAYLAAFKQKDLPSLQEMVKHIRETHDVDMIEDMNQRFENKADTLPNDIEIQSVTKTEDLVTNVGLNQCINIILGTSAKRWSHMAFASGTGAAPLTSNFNLTNYVIGQDILPFSTYGWSEAKGMKLFFGAIVPSTQGSGVGNVQIPNINEIGIYNGTAAGPTDDLLNREVFNANPLTRSIADFFSSIYTISYICSCVIEFCPVT